MLIFQHKDVFLLEVIRLQPIIEIKNLSKVFGSGDGKVAALQDVSVAVQPGEIFGIIGLSGAGKSTLVRCINLLEHPTEGQVLFHGQDLTRVEGLVAEVTRGLENIRKYGAAKAMEMI